MRGQLLCLCFFVGLGAAYARGDDIILRDGTKRQGTIALSPAGAFTLADDPMADPAMWEFVRFPTKPAAFGTTFLKHRVHLANGEVFTAELVRVDETHLYTRTAWAADVAVPRGIVERITHAEGQLLLYDAFDDKQPTWKHTGDPTIADGQAQFTRRNAQLEHTLPKPCATGRLLLRVTPTRTQTRRLTFELAWRLAQSTMRVAVDIDSPEEALRVLAPDPPTFANTLKRTGTTGVLSIDFDPTSLNIFLDDQLLWAKTVALGELQEIRLFASGTGTERSIVDEVLLIQPAKGHVPPWADRTQDALRTSAGDELFGTIHEVTATGVRLKTKANSSAHRWPTFREWTFACRGTTAKTTQGEQVTVKLRSVGTDRDTLTGTLTEWNAKTFTLVHPVFGSRTIPRERLEEIRLLWFGQRVPVRTTPFHLGTHLAAGFPQLKPDGVRLAPTVSLDAPPQSWDLVIEAGSVDPKGTAVEVFVNNERIDTLNRHVDRHESTLRTYRLPVPVTAWRRGDNEIEVRLAQSTTNRTSVDLRHVHLELTQRR